MIRAEASAPPYLLICILLGLLAMFIASFQSFIPVSASSKTGKTNAAATSTAQADGGIATLPDGGSSLALTEEQADDLTSLMRKIQTNPNDADALMEIGDTFLMAKDWARAEAFLHRAVLSRPADIRPRYMLGICQYQQGKMTDATVTFEELLDIKKDPAALYNLAVIYKYHTNQQNKAQLLLEEIISSQDADVDTIERAKKELEGGS